MYDPSIWYSIPYALVVAVFFSLYLYEATERKYYRILNIVPATKLYIFIFFMIFVGLRGFVFTDWINYIQVFRNTPTFPFFDWGDRSIGSMEYGFIFLIKLVKKFSDNYFVFVFISTLIDFILIYIIFKNEKSFALCMLFYYIFSTGGPGFRIEFNLMRNVKSILLFTISLKYIKENNFIKYLFLNVIGCFFHISALLYIPMYFFLKRDILIKHSLLLFVIGNIFYIFQIRWMHGVLNILADIIGGRLGFLLNVYIESETYSSAYGLNMAFFQKVISYAIIKSNEKKLLKSSDNVIYMNIFYMFIILNGFFSEMMIFIIRITMLFVMGYWIIFPRLYFLLSKKKKIIFLIGILLFGIVKMSVPSQIQFRYDNILFGYQSESERTRILRQVEIYNFRNNKR
jgi:hypothetical protein